MRPDPTSPAKRYDRVVLGHGGGQLTTQLIQELFLPAFSNDVLRALEEQELPVRREVQAACELLGLDLLYVAYEGKRVAVTPADDAERLLDAMRNHPLGRDSAIIGEVTSNQPGMATLVSTAGGERIVSVLAGEQLTRIC